MKAAEELTTEVPSAASSAAPPEAAQGFTDAFGDRLTLFDDGSRKSFDMLRFNAEVGDAPGFEHGLQTSLEALGRLTEFRTTAREVARFGDDGVLALISIHTEGRRLSDLMARARGTALAIELVQAIGPALATLHENGLVHGVLTPERIVVSPEGRPKLTEEALGAAIAALSLPAERLRSDFGIAVPDTHDPRMLDPRVDVIQLGFIVLSLLLGRRLDPTEFPGKLSAWLDELARASPEVASVFRPWLNGAFQIGDRRFATAKAALSAFNDVIGSPTSATVDKPSDAGRSTQERQAPPAAGKPAAATEPPPAAARSSVWLWATAVLGLSVLGMGALAGYLYVENLSSSAFVIARPDRPATVPPARVPPAAIDSSTQSADTILAAAGGLVPAPPAFGGVTLTSAIELQVFQNGKLLGSTSSPIAIAAGTHVLDVVSEAYGFTGRQTVEVEGGQMATVRVTLPKGRININAAPWADVEIDGVAAGQTPLANVALTIGEHEIIFRHPELGESRRTAVVTTDGVTRVTAEFRQ